MSYLLWPQKELPIGTANVLNKSLVIEKDRTNYFKEKYNHVFCDLSEFSIMNTNQYTSNKLIESIELYILKSIMLD